MEKNTEAAKLLIHRLVELVKPSRDEKLYGVIGCRRGGQRQEQAGHPDSARGIFDAVMIVSEPFTVAYGMDRLSDVLVVDIGRHHRLVAHAWHRARPGG